MTPAIKLLEKRGIAHTVHEYEHDPRAEAFGMEAAEKLGIDPARVFKTLVAKTSDGKLALGIIPVAERLNLKSIAKAVRARKADMADPAEAERATGYVVGGISPLGGKKRLATVIDQTAQDAGTILVSGGKRGVDIELSPTDLADLTAATFASITA
jgi:Cys-tRNA(Pro)/Cys-tRNA(Cys) deacylase